LTLLLYFFGPPCGLLLYFKFSESITAYSTKLHPCFDTLLGF
jgi:hypothetical protein